jgi:hypothetical protein
MGTAKFAEAKTSDILCGLLPKVTVVYHNCSIAVKRHILTPSAVRAVASLNSAMGRLISGCGCRIFKILTWKLNGELVCTADSSLSSFRTYNNTRILSC